MMEQRRPVFQMVHTISARGSWRAWLAVAALLAATPAAARQMTLDISPATPTWGDVVTLTIAATACSPLSLVAEADGANHRVDVAMSDSCCVPSDAWLCLQHGRFRVEATWRDFAGNSGSAQGLPLADSEQSGQLWFFAADNSELTVKVLSGCGVNDRWWVFLSPSSTVEYQLTVTDTATGRRNTYHHAAGEVTGLTADTDAFPCS